MRSMCPDCEKLNSPMNLYCRQCGASLHGARLVQEVEKEPVEPQEDGPQQRGKDRLQKARWPLLVGLLLAVCLVGIGSFLLVPRLLDSADVATDAVTPPVAHGATSERSEGSRPTHTPTRRTVTPSANTPRRTAATQAGEAPRPTSARAPTRAPSPTPSTAAVPPASNGTPFQHLDDLEPTNVRFLKDPLGGLHFFGEVQNNGAVATEQVEVRVTLLDGDGVPVAAEAAAIPATLIPDGERSPFEVIIRNYPRNWASYQLQVGGEGADLNWRDRVAELEFLEETLDRIDVLVHNAGLILPGRPAPSGGGGPPVGGLQRHLGRLPRRLAERPARL